MKRIWNLRLNLDELNALNLAGLTEHIRSELWSGLVFGCNGLDIPEGASNYLRTTFEVASEWRAEAEGHQARMSEGGKKSASKRRTQFGSAQPSRTTFEPPSEGGPEGGLNQSTIYNLQSNNIQSTNNNPPSKEESSPSRARLSRKMKLSMLDGYPEGALTVVRTLLPIWPEELPDGRKPAFDPHAASARVTEILAANPSIQPQLLIDAGNRYLRTMRETGSERFISALHFFFGPGKGKTMPKWEEQIRAMKHDQSLEQN